MEKTKESNQSKTDLFPVGCTDSTLCEGQASYCNEETCECFQPRCEPEIPYGTLGGVCRNITFVNNLLCHPGYVVLHPNHVVNW